MPLSRVLPGTVTATALFAIMLLTGARGLDAQGLDETARSEVESFLPGMVVGVHHNGEVQILEAFGESGLALGEPLQVDHLFPYPALSEVLLGITVEALHAAGAIDREAPLSRYLPGLSPGVGRITLSQLLTHTSGLDDADRMEGESWDQTLDRIDDRALVAEPGAFYSRSRHSLPLAMRVLSAVVGRSFIETATIAVLRPLGLSRSTFDLDEARSLGLVPGVTRSNDAAAPTQTVEAVDTLDGLPVLFTTTGDVLTLLSAWTEGGIAGRMPHEIAPERYAGPPGDRRFGAGVWVDEYRGLSRASRTGTALGVSTSFHLFPEMGSVVFVWSRGDPSRRVPPLVLGAVADAVGAPTPTAASPGDGEENAPDAVVDASRWAGTYRNGNLIFVLKEAPDGLAFSTGSQDLAVEPLEGNRFAARLPDGRIAVVFDLVQDAADRRYLYYGDLLYRHESDPL